MGIINCGVIGQGVVEFMRMPTESQLGCLYRISYYLTYQMFQPIHLVCIDGRSQNLYVLAGQNEEIEFEVTPNGEVL